MCSNGISKRAGKRRKFPPWKLKKVLSSQEKKKKKKGNFEEVRISGEALYIFINISFTLVSRSTSSCKQVPATPYHITNCVHGQTHIHTPKPDRQQPPFVSEAGIKSTWFVVSWLTINCCQIFVSFVLQWLVTMDTQGNKVHWSTML